MTPTSTPPGFDQGYHIMLVEIGDDELHFQMITDHGTTVDAGMIQRRLEPEDRAVKPATTS